MQSSSALGRCINTLRVSTWKVNFFRGYSFATGFQLVFCPVLLPLPFLHLLSLSDLCVIDVEDASRACVLYIPRLIVSARVSVGDVYSSSRTYILALHVIARRSDLDRTSVLEVNCQRLHLDLQRIGNHARRPMCRPRPWLTESYTPR